MHARYGRTQSVLAQLATYGFDVNAQVEGGGATIGRMTLLSCCCCEIGKGQLALARALQKKPFIEFANIIASGVPIGIFLGRIANFVNGELWGKKTNSNWGVIFDQESMEARHPSQLYEAFFEGLVLFVILFFVITNNKLKKINACSVFLIFYGIFRFSIENFREPDLNLGYIIFNLSMGQILSIPMIFIGLILIKHR